MLGRLAALFPFHTPEGKRLAVLFAIVYFAQGMWYLPVQVVTISLKDRGLSAGQVADFFAITIIPWLIKPAYGLISDFVPLFGYRRKSYLYLSSGTAALAGLALGLSGDQSYWRMAYYLTAMAAGLAFTDVLVDALMVENGKPLGLTGAFQSVQWAAIMTASILVGELGGYLAEGRLLRASFLVAACFPLVSLLMAIFVVREAPAPAVGKEFRETWASIRAALGARDVWVVAGFIFFFTFSPSFGPALLFYQTDVLRFSQQFIGHLLALSAVGAVLGAIMYAPMSRRMRLRRHDHPAGLPGSRSQVLPAPRRGDLFRPPRIRLQCRHAGVAERGRPAVRSPRVPAPRPDLDRHDGGDMAAGAPREDRPHRSPGETGRGTRNLMRWVRLGLFVCGAALFLWLLASIGPGAVVQAFTDLSWRLLIILVFPFGLTTLLDTLGWRYAFRRDTVPFRALLGARLAGEAFNLTTPTASMGGEAVKAWLVRPWAPLAEGLPSVIIAKTTIVTGQALFVVVGLVAARTALASDSLVIHGMEWLLVVQVVAVGGFVVVQAG